MVYGNNINKLSSRIYKALLFDYTNIIYGLISLKLFFIQTGFSYVWLPENNCNCGNFSKLLVRTLRNR